MCWSIGICPSSHPPGYDIQQCPVLPSTEPRKTIEERISRISLTGISQLPIAQASEITVLPLRLHFTPICESIRRAASTSVSLGQLCITLSPSYISTVAASIGSAAFFAPWSESSPSILRPPFIISFCLSKLSPSHSFSSYYATEDNKVKSLLYSHKLRYLTEYYACRITLRQLCGIFAHQPEKLGVVRKPVHSVDKHTAC